MQIIHIKTIRVGSISNIGSLNIGKVILARNRVVTVESAGEPDAGGNGAISAEAAPASAPPFLPDDDNRTDRNGTA